jgi:hypothetical protein
MRSSAGDDEMSAIGGPADAAQAWMAPRRGPAGRLAQIASRTSLAQLLALAAVLRLAVMPIATPVHPDEVFQYLETAHRLVFGHGIVTWEWRAGMRGWLLPWLVAAPMRIGGWIAPDGDLYRVLPNLLMVAASLTSVVVAWRLGARLSRLHAQVAGFVAAIWFEFVYFAPHVMSETVSIALILPAALILVERERWTWLRLSTAAFLLANAAAIRVQHAPAIAVLALACCGRDLRRCWAPMLVGGLAGLIPSALADAAMGATPYAWVLANVRLNIVEHRAEAYSASGPLGYAAELWPRMALWAVPLFALAAVGARRYPGLAAGALANLVFHSAITHKEYRFILFTMVVAVILAAIGTVDWVRAVARKDGAEAGREKLRFLLIVWIAASLSCAVGGYRTQWMKFGPEMDAFSRLRADPATCGVAVYRHDFSITGGYAYLHRPVPILYFADEDSARSAADLAANVGAVNSVLTTPDHAAELPAAFRQTSCEGKGRLRVCLYRRPGGCAATSASASFAMSTVLARRDE